MRLVPRFERCASNPNLLTMRPLQSGTNEGPEPTAFRGFLIAASVSAILWAVGLTAVWYLRGR